MTGQHWTVILVVLGAVVAQIAGLKDWHDALSPMFIAGTAGAVLAALRGLFLPSPQAPVDSVKVPLAGGKL